MKRFLVGCLVLGMLLTGCNKMKGKIVGVWRIDTASIKSAILEQQLADPKHGDKIKKMIDSERYQFESDGTAESAMGGGATRTGKWILDGNKIIVTFDGSLANVAPIKFTVNTDGTRIHVVDSGIQAEMDLIKA